MDKNIITVNYTDEMKKSYIDYAMSVIIQRAIPDVRDGLKPVHRRILYSMQGLALYPDKSYKKSARIVGEVLGKYHPHGDTAVYNAMVRLAQDFSMNKILVDGHGNFGSIDGDVPAAVRYTEAKLSEISLEMLRGLDKNIITFKSNFDESEKEPEVLPSRFCNLLINGASGIAVGMTTNIPPHNFTEVTQGIKAFIDNENITIKELMKYIKAPDFPTGGAIINKKDLLNMYETGSGKIILRAKYKIENIEQGKTNIIITEIPYSFSGSKTKLLENLINKKTEEIIDIRDESSKDGLRIVIELKKGVNEKKILTKLFKSTKLEDSINVKFVAIVNNKPETLTLKDAIKYYVDFLKNINKKEIEYELERNIKRKEIIDGLIKAINAIDLIIEIIRNSKNIKNVKDCLMYGKTDGIKFKTQKNKKLSQKLLFTESQTNAILDIKLHKLVGLEIEILKKEYDSILKEINKFKGLLDNELDFNNYIKNDLDKQIKKYGEKRRTAIIDSPTIITEEKDSEKKEKNIEINKKGYIKILKNANENTIKLINNDILMLFSDKGFLHQLKIKEIPIKEKGVLIDNLINENYSSIIKITTLNALKKAKALLVSSNGYVKIISGIDLITNRKKLPIIKHEKLIDVILLSDETEIYLESKNGFKIRFNLNSIPVQKRNSKGVIGLKLNKNDYIEKVKVEKDTKNILKKRGSKGKK